MNLVSLGVPTLTLRSRVTARIYALSPRRRKLARILSMFGLVALASLLSAEPALAQTNLESFGQSVLNLLSNGLLRTVAILAIIAAGFGWLTGRVNTGALVTVIIGIALIFSAPWIVDQLNAG
ncbi:TrbC/VirB2 family protein [Novosphingobium sp. HR1a]|uniref:TrbC/VirB2 family protein n=1 Tax=Novosphingobium sp. HR1a TaxID=1395637 RepID=UPI001B3C7F0F|nr:TrbC/VirB2 family protein [Novosphingobium sp. HR1a]MBF7015772.1 TrbC/VirB2 family protein [Novosphingobium sp. HR1a]MCC4254689.1 TrbC/VirB2 family protein [Sphingobium naphthae]